MRRRKHYRCQRLSDVKHHRVTGDKKLPLNRSDSVMWKERLLSERQGRSRARSKYATTLELSTNSIEPLPPRSSGWKQKSVVAPLLHRTEILYTYTVLQLACVKYCLNLRCFQTIMYWNLDPQCISVRRRDLGELSELWGYWSYHWLNPLIIAS